MRKTALLLLPLLIFAQNFILQKDVFSSGGRKMTSTDYILQGTISQTTIGAVIDTDYEGVIGFWHPPEPFPPEAPYLYVTKSGSDAVVTWNKITTDTLGNPETMYYYVVYRSTDPSFIPGNSDSIGFTLQPDTTYTDAGVNTITVPSYYYLVKATDVCGNMSKKSNMGYKFNKSVNENAGATSDRNWVSLPWHGEYVTVNDLTDDLSSAGDPLLEITNLRNDQLYESWIYDLFFGWFGSDFSITPGRAYEMVTMNDTILVITGSNDPDGLVTLNENSGASSDRNWVSIPYNAQYGSVSAITTEYSPTGNPLIELTNLRDDQLYESWIYDIFFGWFGTDFSIVRGHGYEFVTIVDTVWDPTEYTNQVFEQLAVNAGSHVSNSACRLGFKQIPGRKPVWEKRSRSLPPGVSLPKEATADCYIAVEDVVKQEPDSRQVGTSHIIFGTFTGQDIKNIAFTAYRPEAPYDGLTEEVIGCGIVEKDGRFGFWFNVGNFMTPWQHGEEVIVLIEVATSTGVLYDVAMVKLDQGVDIQSVREIELSPVPHVARDKGNLTWRAVDDKSVIGYSVYDGDLRLNDRVLTEAKFTVRAENVMIRPVIEGGYETVLSPVGAEDKPLVFTPITYAFRVFPNPFVGRTAIDYALPRKTRVDIAVYDVTGRRVRSLVSGPVEPGFYNLIWDGSDDLGRQAAAGVYFVSIDTDDYQSRQKVILVR